MVDYSNITSTGRVVLLVLLLSTVLIAGCTAPEDGEDAESDIDNFSEAPDLGVEEEDDAGGETNITLGDTSEISGEEPQTGSSPKKINLTGIDGKWPLPHYDTALTSHSPESSGPEGNSEVTTLYRSDNSITGTPVIKNKIAVFASGKHLIALDASNGKEIWNFTAEKTLSQPAISGSTVYISTRLNSRLRAGDSGKVYGFRLENGDILMEKEISKSPLNDILPLKDSIYIPQEDEIISRTAPGESLLEARDIGISNIMLSGKGDTVFASAGAGNIYRFSIGGGNLNQVWKRKAGSSIAHPPVVGENSIYVTPMKVSGIDLNNTNISEFRSNPPSAQSIEIKMSLESRDRANGDRNWIKEFEAPMITSPILYGDSVTVSVSNPQAQESVLKTYNRESGELIWEKTLSGFYNTLSSGRDTLYLASPGGRINALTHDGEELWTRQIGGAITSPPAVVGDYLFVGDQNGEVYAVE